jgi:succinyl-CoA reductase
VLDGIPASGKGALFIGGTWRPPAGGTYARVVDPSTGRTLGEAPVASSEEARAAVDAAAAVEERWADVPGHERARILRAAAERLRSDRETMARLIASEVGKPIVDARVEVDRAVGVYLLAAEEIRHLGGESFPADAYERPAGNESRFLFSVRDPIGVVVAIGPFNFPLNLLSHKIAPALAAGNPVVAKPTSAAPFTALRLAEHLAAAGVLPGALNVVVGPGGSVGNVLVDHPRTRLVTFTGSTEVGKGIAERAGRHAKRVILEMGGMDPFIVLDDAALEVAVPAAVRGAFGYSGQVCTASKRILVQDSVAEKFARALAEKARTLRVGPALEETTEVGPLIDAAAVERVELLIDDARSRSAKVLTGGDRPASASEGHFYNPTVLDRVPEDARVATEEPFGPIAPVLRFRDVEDAVRIANSTPYGLQAAVYTRDIVRGFALAKRIRAGGVHLNDPTNLRWDALPFGGVKESGLGREGLRYAMQEMTEVKLISVNFAPPGP